MFRWFADNSLAIGRTSLVRAVEALAHAFDAAREVEDQDTLFQTREARRPSEPPAAPEEDMRQHNLLRKESLQ